VYTIISVYYAYVYTLNIQCYFVFLFIEFLIRRLIIFLFGKYVYSYVFTHQLYKFLTILEVQTYIEDSLLFKGLYFIRRIHDSC